MAIRLSGMTSGLDTEALVSAMVMNYTAKVTKNQQAQTLLSYKRDALKSINSDVYSLFGAADKMRWSSAYSLKSTSVSDTTKAKITASNNAANGTQTLEVSQLAQAGYLTGGVTKSSAGKLGQDTKLGDLYTSNSDNNTNTFSGAGSVTVTLNGKETQINLSEDMTVKQFTNKLKDLGLNASFDENYGRFYISSKTTGSDGDFSIVANDSVSMKGLQALGIYTADDTTKAAYETWSKYSDDDVRNIAQKQFESQKAETAATAQSYFDRYQAATDTIKALDDTFVSASQAASDLADKKSELKDDFSSYVKKAEDGTDLKDDKGNLVYDTEAMSEDEKTRFEELNSEISKLTTAVESYDAQQNVIRDTQKYVVIDPVDKTAKAATADDTTGVWTMIDGEVNTLNANNYAALEESLMNKRDYNKQIYDNFGTYGSIGGAVRITGLDAKIKLNGVEYTGKTNNFSINGLNIEATALTKPGEAITITTSTDNQGLYDQIKDFLGQYNDVINKINKMYNAASSKGYDPLTEEQKAAMSDTEVEKWEKKIKDSVLRRDGTLSSVLTSVTSLMSKVQDINGEKISLGTFGISTLGLFSSEKNEQYAYHIDGDADDSSVSGKTDKLMAAISSNPEQVASFFQKLSNELYTTLNNKMKSSSMSSAYTIYNDKQMDKEYNNYSTTIKKWQDKVSTMETQYYKRFTAMEKTLAQLQSSTSSLSSMLG